MENQSSGFMSGLRAFGRGLLTGLFSGGLIAGVYALVTAAIQLVPTAAGIGFMSSWAIVGLIATTAIFTGVMGVYRDYQHRKQAAQGQMREGHVAAASPTVVPMLIPAVAADRAESPAQATPEQEAPARNWAASVAKDRSNGDQIQQILSDKKLDDKTRAAAILQEREARAAIQSEAAR
jgi:hypothetical protein